MINLIVFTASSVISIYFIKSINKTKQESLRNKILFIDEFKKSELNNHSYTVNNYLSIKRWVESKYPALEKIKENDAYYTQCLFKEERSSLKYNCALTGKHDIAMLKQEIEFDTLRECFSQICKNDTNCKSREFLCKNKHLIYLFTQSIIFTKKISKEFKLAMLFTCISLFCLIKTICF